MRSSSWNKLLILFIITICSIGVTLALLTTAHNTTAKNDDAVVVAENLRLKHVLSQLSSSLISHHFRLTWLNGNFSSLEDIIKKAIIELRTDDERINKLLGNFLLLIEFCHQKLENIMQENNATIASLLKNIEATHAAERNNEGDFVSAVKKAEGFVRDISEKGFVLTKEVLKRAEGFVRDISEKDFVLTKEVLKRAEGFVRDISEKGFVLTKEVLKRAEGFVRDISEKDFVLTKEVLKRAEGFVRDISEKDFVLTKEVLKRAEGFVRDISEKGFVLTKEVLKRAEGFVRDISEKGFVLTKEVLKRAEAFEKQNIGLSEKMNFWLSSTFDRVVAKYGEYLGQKSKENVNEEKEGDDQIHEF